MKGKLKKHTFHLGFILLGAGTLLKHIVSATEGTWEALPHVLSGVGSGIMLVGIVLIFKKREMERNPEKARKVAIDEKDERNILINEKASHITWMVTFCALAILTIVSIVMNNIIAAAFLAGVMLIHKASLVVSVRLLEKKL